MEINEHLDMAYRLFKRGKFDKYVSKDLSRFEELDYEGVTFAGVSLKPYYDQKNDMVVFGKVESQAERERLMYVAFRDYEYRFNETSDYTWYDAHTYGFKDIKKKK